MKRLWKNWRSRYCPRTLRKHWPIREYTLRQQGRYQMRVTCCDNCLHVLDSELEENPLYENFQEGNQR